MEINQIKNKPENKLAQPAHCLVDVKKLQPPPVDLMEKVIGVDKDIYNRNLEVLTKAGEFEFELDKYLPLYLDVDLDFRLMERVDVNRSGKTWVYIGQYIKNTITKHGVGITIWDDGQIHQGYYKHGNTYGKGRRILASGDFYVGTEINKYRQGFGTLLYLNGNKYEGYFKNGK